MASYHYFLTYLTNLGPISVDELMRKLPIPRKWRHFLRTGNQILTNGHYSPLNFLVKVGDKIDIYLDHVGSEQQTYTASGSSPEAMYEDPDILIIDKSVGQKTHPNLNEKDTALNDCATYLGYNSPAVHRLDMLINGLLLVAKSPVVVPILNWQLTNKTLYREYLAWVSKPNQLKQSGIISLSIGHDPNDQRERIVRPDDQKAITHYEIVRECENKVSVKLTLETGRIHQIRVYSAAPNALITGNPLYNPNYQKGESLQLTVCQLTFMRPFKFGSRTVRLRQK